MKYQNLTDLPKPLVKKAVQKILNPEKIVSVRYDKKYDTITMELEYTWFDGEEEFTLTDECDLTKNGIFVPWTESEKSTYLWRQFCIAHGCNELFKNNPWLEGKEAGI